MWILINVCRYACVSVYRATVTVCNINACAIISNCVIGTNNVIAVGLSVDVLYRKS